MVQLERNCSAFPTIEINVNVIRAEKEPLHIFIRNPVYHLRVSIFLNFMLTVTGI